MEKEKIKQFWITSSDNDFKTMDHLFKKKDYHWSLFMGHLVIEKLLKAYYIKNIDNNVPMIHDLLRIAKKSNLDLTGEQEDFLDIVTTFNIQARYDDYKMEFYKKCTKEFTIKMIKKIREFRTWIKKQIL